MIQRIQTIYFILSGLAMSLLFVFPLATIESSEKVVEFCLSGLREVDAGNVILDAWPLVVLALIIISINLLSIFLYTKRVIQMRLSVYNILLTIGFMALGVFYGKQGNDMVSGKLAMEYFSVMPVIAIIFSILGWRGVRKDYLMLKAVDRIR